MVGGFVGWGVITGLLAVAGIAASPASSSCSWRSCCAMVACGALGYGIERDPPIGPCETRARMGVIISGLGVSIALRPPPSWCSGPGSSWSRPAGFCRTPGRSRSAGSRSRSSGCSSWRSRSCCCSASSTWCSGRGGAGRPGDGAGSQRQRRSWASTSIASCRSCTSTGSALAGVAGVLVGLLYTRSTSRSGSSSASRPSPRRVIGGIGYIRGAFLGGLVLGMVESLATGFISPRTRT